MSIHTLKKGMSKDPMSLGHLSPEAFLANPKVSPGWTPIGEYATI